MTNTKMWLVVAALLVAQMSPAVAQEKQPADSIPLRVQVVLSRYDGEKRLSSLPYTLWVNATRDRSNPVILRMGVQIPVPTTTKEGTSSVTFRNIGTNIDCEGRIMDDGRFRLTFGIEQSSIAPESPKSFHAGIPVGQMIRSFTTNFVLALRDGQTAQNTTATDPVNGEVLKVDVTMNVIK